MLGLAAADHPRRHRHRVHARAAQAVESHAARFVGKAGEQAGHAGEVAIVLAGLVGAAVDDVVELVPVDPRIALDQRPDRDGGEIVGADMGEAAAVAADRRAHGVADEGFGHSFVSDHRAAEAARKALELGDRAAVPGPHADIVNARAADKRLLAALGDQHLALPAPDRGRRSRPGRRRSAGCGCCRHRRRRCRRARRPCRHGRCRGRSACRRAAHADPRIAFARLLDLDPQAGPVPSAASIERATLSARASGSSGSSQALSRGRGW